MSGGNSRKHRDPIPVPDDSVNFEVTRDHDVAYQPSSSADAIDPDAGTGVGAVVVHHVVTAIIVVLVVALGTWTYLTFKKTSFFSIPEAAERGVFDVYAVDAQRDRIEFALSVYHELNEKYPSSLDVLVDENLLEASDLSYPPGEYRYVYQRSGDSYQLEVIRERTLEREVEVPGRADDSPKTANEPR